MLDELEEPDVMASSLIPMLCLVQGFSGYISVDRGFEHSGDISCSLLVNPSHTNESWEGRNTCMWIYTL